jgi:RNA polymerase sigma-70 factor (ECF subfamily)
MHNPQPETDNRHGRHGETWFNGLFDLYYPAVRNYSFQLLGDMDAAQEAAQDAFVRLWEKGARDGGEQAVRAFLFTIARNICIDRIRSDRVITRYRRKIMLKYSEVADSLIDDIITSDLREMLDRQIDALPPQCARAFRLSRGEYLTYAEIAARMGITVKAVEANISRAIALLRTKMGDQLLVAAMLLLLRMK